MFARKILLVALVLACFAPIAFAADPDPNRGRALYDEHCGECHTTQAHARDSHVANDYSAIREWVARWNRNLELRWSDREIEDVTMYLNNSFYRYPCPPDVCKVVARR